MITKNLLPGLISPVIKYSFPTSFASIRSVIKINNVTITYYTDGGTSSVADQVLYENNIYECMRA